MKSASVFISLIIAVAVLAVPTDSYAEDKAAIAAMEAYFDFSEYESGTILPEQIHADDWKKFYVVDTRDAEQFQKAHIPGAVNIEWRKVLGQRSKLPHDKMVLLYCNTGTLSSQAAMALRVAGMEHVRILQGGFTEWKAKGGFEANRIASKKSAK
ncbi:MAG: sulfurtransferase [Gallionellales bacterium 35-53-114]|jgi:rhodanese-related sulfurtransferase|nr:MAG: sulfurtransferase [Gallionellales bacterium 35-53-114]OYZ64950.1 MAG: sulfurtransferase [Gallionellales bacterium 24-53-125]OZB07512.1 MAG: sulfurtransferase [Gallionellales bacterium 39-52-133]HQS58816.1 rhodanese-like domain-containing protein [Gallionellaceae bacterium]HQS75157.1 rhodanese-like domain-containing protein [Gallionellaceae bacterium]